jgi:hypothetical protein
MTSLQVIRQLPLEAARGLSPAGQRGSTPEFRPDGTAGLSLAAPRFPLENETQATGSCAKSS